MMLGLRHGESPGTAKRTPPVCAHTALAPTCAMIRWVALGVGAGARVVAEAAKDGSIARIVGATITAAAEPGIGQWRT
jgi:hypothetical protein